MLLQRQEEKTEMVLKNLSSLSLALAIACGTLSGCSEYGGGAVTIPQVAFIPDASNDGGDADGGGAVVSDAVGSIRGRVIMSGGAPALPLLVSMGTDVKDAEVCAAVDVPDERLQLSSDGGVANVFVYLGKKPPGGRPLEASGETMFFDQKNCRFFPHTMIVPVDQTVKVLSSDSVAHNTHTYPSKNNSVNSGVAPNDREGKLEILYSKAESVPLAVKCDYHAWMNAWHLPLDHPFGAVTNENGEFSISDLPVGKHSFIVWHEAAKGNFVERKLEVEVREGETTDLTIDYPVASLQEL